MVQLGGEAQTAAQGTANPACGSRGMSCDFAVLHAFGASELEKIRTSRMMPLLTCVLFLCRNASQYLR
jgi:hypothetical protein